MKSETYETTIQPNQSFLRFDWQGLLHYRDLLFLLVWRDFVSKYKQTILGPLWFILQPLLTTLVFSVVFGAVAKIPTDGVPPPLFYLCGQLGWNYFSQTLTTTGSTFLANAHIFGKVYFPRIVVPLSIVLSNLIAFVIQLVTFLCFYVYFKFFTASGGQFQAQPTIFLLPLLLLHSALLGLGVGLWMSALTAKYRDFNHLLGFMAQVWMYITPVIIPFSQFLEHLPKGWQWVALANPMTMVVESYRSAFLGAGTVTPFYYGISITITLLVFFSGLMMFQRAERTFVDTI